MPEAFVIKVYAPHGRQRLRWGSVDYTSNSPISIDCCPLLARLVGPFLKPFPESISLPHLSLLAI